jgi:hypothetical protein
MTTSNTPTQPQNTSPTPKSKTADRVSIESEPRRGSQQYETMKGGDSTSTDPSVPQNENDESTNVNSSKNQY